MELPDHEVAIFGVSGVKREARAFPIELVVAREGDEVMVLIVDGMYRMKMFFEDAGRMKLARKMRVPGSIEDGIEDMAGAVLF